MSPIKLAQLFITKDVQYAKYAVHTSFNGLILLVKEYSNNQKQKKINICSYSMNIISKCSSRIWYLWNEQHIKLINSMQFCAPGHEQICPLHNAFQTSMPIII